MWFVSIICKRGLFGVIFLVGVIVFEGRGGGVDRTCIFLCPGWAMPTTPEE